MRCIPARLYAIIAAEEIVLTILLIEDNETITKGLSYAFEKNKYVFDCVATVREASAYVSKRPDVDLVILDIALPDGNGFELYNNTIKRLGIPTIFLTARDDEDDIVKGLEVGAEDYVTKPFSTKELLARVNRVLLRNGKPQIIRIRDVSFDPDKPAVFRGDRRIDLSPLEMKIISLLFANLNRVVTRNTLLDRIWEWTGNDVDDHTVTVYFNRIRDKLGSDIIITVKGIGYRIDEQ